MPDRLATSSSPSREVPLRPPEGPRARGLLALALAGASAFLNVYATQPLLPLIEHALGVSKAGAALTVSAPSIAVALASPFAGALADRVGRRRMIVGSLFVLVVPSLLAATSRGVAELVLWRFLQGAVVPGVYAVGVAYAGAEWEGRGVGRAMAAIVTGNVIGGFLGRVVSGGVAELAGWRAAFVALAALTFAGAIGAWRWLPESTRPGPTASALGLRWRDVARCLGDARVAATFAVGFSVLFAQVATFTYVGFHLSEAPFSLGAGALSSIFVVYLVGAAVTPIAGRWIDRVGSRAVLVVAVSGAMVGSALTLVPSLPAVVAGLALACTAVFVSQSASTAFLPRAAPEELRSVASGLYISSYYVGGAVGGVLPSAAWHLGGWPACVALVITVQLGTMLLALRYWRKGAA
jgi:predicted MFS family arabinose efflux permease